MVGLLDIVPHTEDVTIGQSRVPVCGVSAKGIAYLLGKYPDLLRKFFAKDEEGGDSDDTPIEPSDLLKLGGDIVASIIAAGVGFPGNVEYEEQASKIRVGEQLDLLDAILRLTMPNGVGPFVERLTSLKRVLTPGGGVVAAVPQGGIKVRTRPSRPPFSASAPQATKDSATSVN
ncbi:MAG: hypothetical protein JWL86_5414 [Rhizobium sp.]|nr:hypothetical protein [Rhizobium sp.]